MAAGRVILVAALAVTIGLGTYWFAQRLAVPGERQAWTGPPADNQLITAPPTAEEADEDVLNADDYLGEALEDLRAVE